MTFDDIDWPSWQPVERATLLFVVRDERILLIRKKRGLGAGKVNGPGGRIDPGESPAECAVRECQEELLITPTGVVERGELRFQFVDGHAIHGYVFTATDYAGTPTETDEAVPLWTPVDAIPFDEMWEDDRLWLPLMLEGRWFDGRFLFDDDRMLGHTVDVEEPRRSVVDQLRVFASPDTTLDSGWQALRSLAASGSSRSEVQGALESLREQAASEGEEDRVLELLDYVTGFCAPRFRIWADDDTVEG